MPGRSISLFTALLCGFVIYTTLRGNLRNYLSVLGLAN